MLNIRKAGERGHADHGWLNTYHTFSFANYYDPDQMGFRALRVINEDRVQKGTGFPTHPHQNMEIISYVLEGALEHRDSMGNGSVIRPGEVQRMSAGTGITHSEYNHSKEDPLHFLQIWIMPERNEVIPSYEQKFFTDGEKRKQLCLIASSDGRDGSVTIRQDVNLYAALLECGEEIVYRIPHNRYSWLQVVRGNLLVNGQHLEQGDGAAVSIGTLDRLTVSGRDKAELLIFDLS
ncbi:MAG: pirin family protein [Desulfuromonadaceae bacterium]|nr:pirin family protein [Desulfuromonadaceae bacterium]